MINVILCVECILVFLCALPLFAYYGRMVVYNLFCCVWNAVAFVINVAVFLWSERRK